MAQADTPRIGATWESHALHMARRVGYLEGVLKLAIVTCRTAAKDTTSPEAAKRMAGGLADDLEDYFTEHEQAYRAGLSSGEPLVTEGGR